MAVRLFVGNLPYNVTEAELREHFTAVGPVAGVWIATDRETGRPRGFAFVEYEDRAMAEEAIRRFNSKPFNGRPLAVNEARPQERGSAPPPRRPPSAPPPSQQSGPRQAPSEPRYYAPPPPPEPESDESGFGRPGRDRSRNFGPNAPAGRKPAAKKKDRGERRGGERTREPKRPIQVASGGRFYSSDDFDDFDDDDKNVLDEDFDDELDEDSEEETPESER